MNIDVMRPRHLFPLTDVSLKAAQNVIPRRRLQFERT
jgi:hypothetical protein